MLALRRPGALVALVVVLASPRSVRGDPPPLLPRAEVFADAARTYPQLSPDGKRLGWLATDAQGRLQVHVGTIDAGDARPVTAESRPVREWWWSGDARSVLFLQDALGDENRHLLAVDLAGGHVRDLTPFRGVRVNQVFVSPATPGIVKVALNLRDPAAFDVHRIDLDTGAITLDTQNPGNVVAWTCDAALGVRAALRLLPDGSPEALVRAGPDAPWQPVARGQLGDTLAVVSVAQDARTVHLLSSVGADKVRLLVRQLPDGPERVLAESRDADALAVAVDAAGEPTAVQLEYLRSEWKPLTPDAERLLRTVRKLAPGADVAAVSPVAFEEGTVWSWDRERRHAVVAIVEDRVPKRFVLYDAARDDARVLFVDRAAPRAEGFAEVRPVVIRARDGVALPSYLALPAGRPAGRLPLVLLVHGGPTWRDSWPWHPVTQWLANRGYAVLRVNFRGSTGFGKAHVKRGFGEVGRKMQDDLTDAVGWAVKEGVADPARVAIVGKSYGGYAALAGASLTPELYRCAVSYVGVADLISTVRSFPAYWGPAVAEIHAVFGDPDVPAQAERMRAVSPVHLADRIRIPLLVGQGANDVRVKKEQAEAIFAAVARNGGRATYVLYGDEGHGPPGVGPDVLANRVDWYARVEAFLAEHLGGRAEPLDRSRAAPSTAVVQESRPPAPVAPAAGTR